MKRCDLQLEERPGLMASLALETICARYFTAWVSTTRRLLHSVVSPCAGLSRCSSTPCVAHLRLCEIEEIWMCLFFTLVRELSSLILNAPPCKIAPSQFADSDVW